MTRENSRTRSRRSRRFGESRDPQFFAGNRTFVTKIHAECCARRDRVELGRLFTHRIGIDTITPVQVQDILRKLSDLVEDADDSMTSPVPDMILEIITTIEEDMV